MLQKLVILKLALALAVSAGAIQQAAAQAGSAPEPASAQAQPTAPQPLSDDELHILVARIALYPDELVAVIVAASLYPLQIVEAARFLDQFEKNKDLKPKAEWDGSVISLLNYPEIVRMMSDDLDWTQAIGEAILNQEKDVLLAIQQLREQAVANGIIKTDKQVTVVEENDNIVIKSADPQIVYIPQYQPEMLYVPSYPVVPITYYPTPYPSYYWPGATFFAGVVTGAIWGGVVDWNDGFWGGRWDAGDIDVDIDCNKCFNDIDFSGKVNINDVDWTKIDRTKINIDKNQFNNIDRTSIQNNIKNTDINKVRNKAGDVALNRPTTLPAGKQPKDIRKSTLEGLKGKPATKDLPAIDNKLPRPATGDIKKPDIGNLQKPDLSNVKKPDLGNVSKDIANIKRPDLDNISRPAGKPKPLANVDRRPANPAPIGEIRGGAKAKVQSARGSKAMGGGGIKAHGGGGGGHKAVNRGGGGRRR